MPAGFYDITGIIFFHVHVDRTATRIQLLIALIITFVFEWNCYKLVGYN